MSCACQPRRLSASGAASGTAQVSASHPPDSGRTRRDSGLTRPGEDTDAVTDLLEPDTGKRAQAERATDAIRARFGKDAILKGRALR